ncbi:MULTISPECIES: hypothetical protein [Sphingobacterium]|uniref:hypothetical protein n=1 Tax=Sphingobacterium TaxID=28453 RepID=UPI0013DC7B15|nr:MULTISPECIES: hypothetical protein [unclassified Sphingobacterium]
MKINYFFVFLLMAFSTKLSAQDDAAELAKKLSNPVGALISVPLQNNLEHGIGVHKGSRYTLNVQPVIPFVITENLNLITRTIIPVVSQYNVTGASTAESGLSDIVASAFLSPRNAKGLIWGAGPVFLIPSGSHEYLTGKKIGVGPTAILLKQANGWTYGTLINQIWSVAGSSSRNDISRMYMNPFISHNWKSGAGMNLNVDWTQDWKDNTGNVSLTTMFTGVTSFGNQRVSLGVGPRFNLYAPEAVKSRFGIRANLVFIFPK